MVHCGNGGAAAPPAAGRRRRRPDGRPGRVDCALRLGPPPPPVNSPANPPLAGARRQAALVFIFVTVLIDVLAFGVIIPVLPHLVESFVGGDTSTAAYWVGIFGTEAAD